MAQWSLVGRPAVGVAEVVGELSELENDRRGGLGWCGLVAIG